MKTDDLIETLAGDLQPVSRHAVLLRFASGIGVGALVSFLLMSIWLGIRPDLESATTTWAYWIKFAYTLGLASFALWATERLARPAMRANAAFIGMALVGCVLLAIAVSQWMAVPPAERMPLTMGHSARMCPLLIFVLSLPIFAGTVWSLRALAPTNLALEGAIAGFASGALGAWIYAFHCNESAAPFVLVFYSLAIALLAFLGFVTARLLVRW